MIQPMFVCIPCIAQRNSRKRGNRKRGGSVLVCLLACAIVVTAIAATSVQAVLRARRESKIELQVMQAELLCHAGILRAHEQMTLNADYRGELWNPTLDARESTIAEIHIAVEVRQGVKELIVDAKLTNPDSSLPVVRRSCQLEIANSKNTDS